jgi:uncharacterized protein (DUF697 family)
MAEKDEKVKTGTTKKKVVKKEATKKAPKKVEKKVSNKKADAKVIKTKPKVKKEPKPIVANEKKETEKVVTNTAADVVPVPEESVSELEERNSSTIVRNYMLLSMGAGLIPIPVVDFGLLTGLQLKMLAELAKQYNVEFSDNKGKSIIASLLGSLTAVSLRRSFLTRFIKSIPIIGILGSITMPIYGGAATFAIGQLFIKHFESGGTLLDFDSQKAKDSMNNLFKKGKKATLELDK